MKLVRHLLLITGVFLAVAAASAAEQDENGVYIKFDKNPVPVKTPPPVFPIAMRGTDGIVAVLVVIDEKGAVENVTVSKSTNSAFDAPSIEALKHWKFKPAEVDGHPVKAKVTIPLHFNSDN